MYVVVGIIYWFAAREVVEVQTGSFALEWWWLVVMIYVNSLSK